MFDHPISDGGQAQLQALKSQNSVSRNQVLWNAGASSPALPADPQEPPARLCVIFNILRERICMQKNHLYELTRAVIRAYSSLLLRMDVHWHEHRLPDGPKIFVANHPSASDPFLIHLISRGHLSVFVSGNAFSVPLFGRYLRYTRQIAVRPEERGQALEQARGYLEAGHSIGIFPEGNISPQTGGFREPRTGAARLALSTGVPVVPVGIYLPRERTVRISSRLSGQPTVGYWYLRGPYGMTVGQPMHFHGDIEDRAQVNSVSSALMHHIKALAYESEQRVRGHFPPAAAAAGAL